LFSGLVNLLMLTGPLYMLQIYDRVLTSRSVPTLIALSIFLVAAFLLQGVLDLIRLRVVVHAAAFLDQQLAQDVHRAVINLDTNRQPGQSHQPVRDLDQIRAFLTSAGPIAMFDLPWIPVFLGLCFVIHPWLGFVSLAGGIALFSMTLLTERASRAPARNTTQEGGMRSVLAEADRRNRESIIAMGMAAPLTQRWVGLNDRYVAAIARATDVTGSFSSVSKILRLSLQSAVLGVGAYLVIRQELTAGSMIAASIMMGRALAPIETVIANWRVFVTARQSVARLSEALVRSKPKTVTTLLSRPARSLDIDQLKVAAPGNPVSLVANVCFRLKAGEALGIVGPSGAGKTSLVRTLVGIWPPASGTVRIDGATLDQWDPQLLGQHLGFVSQNVELFEGTISENIARMAKTPDAEAVIRAATAAGAHQMILKFPGGYDTKIGEGGAVLSAGQRQRIALARALFGDPFLVVLDEPNSNLDSEGDNALQQAIIELRARGAIVVLIAHRASALSACDYVLLLANGVQQAFGPRDEVLRKLMTGPVPVPSSGANLKVVGEEA
jgi:ATP-binding cassette, subfamily C, type I secretion system permease/ATPase